MRAASWALCLCLCSGCASYYVGAADRDGYRIQAEKAAEVERFQRTQTLDPRENVAKIDEVPPPVEVPEVLDLITALNIGTAHNRDFQTRRESFFLSALSLGLVRRDFLEPIFSGSVAYSVSDGRENDFADGTTANLAVSQFLYTGATITASTTGSLSHVGGKGGRDQDANLSAGVTISQPLLRGAGHTIAFEGLTQAERDALYDARDFELFRQSFTISIINDFYGLVSQRRQIENLEQNRENLQRVVDQAKAFFRVGRGSQVDVFRAEQSLFETENGLLDSEQAFRLSLDRFKIRLGLPTNVELVLADDLPTQLVEFDVDLSTAIAAAFNNRLDLETLRDQVEDRQRQVNVARNNLLPDLDLNLSYDTTSERDRTFRSVTFNEDLYSVSLALELPLNRRAERNRYRAALIELDRARRDLRQFEDNLILEVRDSLRTLQQRKSQIQIDDLNIESLRKRVRQAELENRAGLATNRDVTEAQDQLTQAQNSQLARYVDYEISRLNLLRQLGILFVDDQGQIER